MKPFCDILKQKRIEQNISRKELSLVTDISLSSLSLYESGKSDPTGPVLIQLARALHTSIDDLVGYSVDPLPEYERYKKYLESIGAKVQEESEWVIISIPSRPKGYPSIFQRENFCKEMRMYEEQATAQGEREKAKAMLDIIQQYALVSVRLMQAVMKEQGVRRPCDVDDTSLETFIDSDKARKIVQSVFGDDAPHKPFKPSAQ